MWRSRPRGRRLGDELRFHRDRLIADYMAAGMDRQQAERRAVLEFGNIEQIEEACRDVRGRWLEDLSKDLRYTLRSLRRNPWFSAVAVLSLALGIGANAAIFTLINAVLVDRESRPRCAGWRRRHRDGGMVQRHAVHALCQRPRRRAVGGA